MSYHCLHCEHVCAKRECRPHQVITGTGLPKSSESTIAIAPPIVSKSSALITEQPSSAPTVAATAVPTPVPTKYKRVFNGACKQLQVLDSKPFVARCAAVMTREDIIGS